MRKIWKLLIVCFLCALCSLPDQVNAQTQPQKKITIEISNERLPSVLKRLEKISGYKILFTYDDVKKYTVSGVIKDKAIEQALDIILTDKPLEYHIENQFITITPKGPSKQAKIFNVKGVVISGDDGQPLIGATVLIKGTKTGVLTDIDGKFLMEKVPSNATLQFSYIGMTPQDLSPTPDMKVTLESDVQSLSEVVVTGMQRMDKRMFTGATAQLSADNVKIDGMPEISRALEGRAAGVSVQNVSGSFGTAPKIRVRGATSIYGSSKPLWVVDGVVMEDVTEVSADQLSSGDAVTLISSAIAGLNADDIESFQILKDGSATSIYGARAMAGVIVVTTKKGKAGISRINYTGEYSIRLKPSYSEFNIMNSQEQMGVYKEMQKKGWLNFAETYRAADSGVYGKMYQLMNTYDPVTGQFALMNIAKTQREYLKSAEMRNTDWFDELFRTNIMHNHSVSLSSGTEKASFYASLSALVDPGWTQQSSVNRYTANLNATFNISKTLSINLISSASYRKQRAPGTLSQSIDPVYGEVRRDFDINPYSYALNTSRTLSPDEFYTRNYSPFNIMYELDNNYMNLHVVDMKFQSELKWKPIQGLELSALGAVKYQTTSQEHFITDNSNQAQAYRAMGDATIRDKNPFLYTNPDDPYALPISILPQGGIYQKTDYKMVGYDFRATANYNHSFGESHITNLFLGTETNSIDRNKTFFNGWGMQYTMGAIPFYTYQFFKKSIEEGTDYYSVNDTRARNVAFFANGTYSFQGKYTLNGTIRYEGTNKLGKARKSRWLPTWNIAAAWNIHEESFFKAVEPILSHFTLKTSYSLTADRGPADVSNSMMILKSFKPYRPFTNVQESGMYLVDLENSELTYEKKHELNIGVDMGFLDNRINLSADWYSRNNFDLIGIVNSQGVGGKIAKMANIASMKSHGIEFTLSTKNIVTKDFDWNSDFIFSNSKNEVTDLKSNASIIDLVTGSGFAREGYPVRGLFSIPFLGLNEDGFPMFRNSDGSVTVTDINFQERENVDFLIYEEPTDPTITGSFGNIFRYKNFRLNIFLTYSFGNKIRLDPVFSNKYTDLTAMPKEYKNRWVIPGDEATTNIPVIANRRQSEKDRYLKTAYNSYNYSDARVADGGFIRMKEVSLSYDFPQTWLTSLHLNSLSLKLQATNLCLLYADSKLNGQDPEFFRSGGVATPVPKQFTLTLRLGL